ncbi:hypothetical protein S245_048931, partial [Arachis hypogaea]
FFVSVYQISLLFHGEYYVTRAPTNKNDKIKIEEEDKNYEINNEEEEETESSEMGNKERQEELHATEKKFTKNKMYMLVLSYFLLVVGSCSDFPLLLIPIFLPYFILKSTIRKPFTDFNRKILTLLIFLGIILEINNVIFSYAASYLLVSTSSLLLSSQLGFNLVLSVIMGKQKITFGISPP